MQSSLAALQEELARERENLNRESSRLDSLLELQKNFEGYQEGVRAILLKRQAQGAGQNGICGLVEDIIEADPQYECVVESVLGEKLQHFIVQNHEESLKAIEYLKAEGSGRSSFIPLQVKQNPLFSSGGSAPEGAVVPLLDVIKVKEEFVHLAQHLFGDVWIVPDLPQAIALWNRNSIWKTLVTLDGEVLHPSGVVTGGSKEQATSGTFHRKREIRELSRSTEELRETVAALEGKQDGLQAEMKALEVSVEELTRALHQEELRIVSETKELDQGQAELKRWQQQIETLRFEESQLAEERVEVQEQARAERRFPPGSRAGKTEPGRGPDSAGEGAAGPEGGDRGPAGGSDRSQAAPRHPPGKETEPGPEPGAGPADPPGKPVPPLPPARRSSGVPPPDGGGGRAPAAGRDGPPASPRGPPGTAGPAGREEGGASGEREKQEKSEVLWKERRESLRAVQEQRNGLSLKLMETELNVKHLLSSVEEKHRITAEAFLSREQDQDYFAPEVEARLCRTEIPDRVHGRGEPPGHPGVRRMPGPPGFSYRAGSGPGPVPGSPGPGDQEDQPHLPQALWRNLRSGQPEIQGNLHHPLRRRAGRDDPHR